MSTMKRPEMEVVRFKEADIIVASGNIATLSGFSDTSPDNGTVRYGNTTYDYTNYHTSPYGGGNAVFNNGDWDESLDDLFAYDAGRLYIGFDGNYKYNESDGKFYKQ